MKIVISLTTSHRGFYMRTTGHYENLGTAKCFVPFPLPPHDPPFAMTTQMATLLSDTMHQLGKLNEMSYAVPDIKRFIKAYVIKEALLSSAIEGVNTTLLEVLTQPLLSSKPGKNTQLVMNYTSALEVALLMTKKEGLPLSSRVIKRAHETLMEIGEGDKSDPGHYRKQAVRVGDLIPAPPLKIDELMSHLETYMHTDETLPMLIKSGLIHVQFETIHPFLDGNGRLGRLLIVLTLIDSGLLSAPILYPSYYFKKNRLDYYRWLDRVRTHGDFEGWITFYLTGIRDSCVDAYRRAKDIEKLQQQLAQQIVSDKKVAKKAGETRLRALSTLFSWPIININELSAQLGVSYNTANQIIDDLVAFGILVEETGKKRGKLYKFEQYLAALEQEYT